VTGAKQRSTVGGDPNSANQRIKIYRRQRTRLSDGHDRDDALRVLNMDWVRAHYERVLLIAAAALLFISSILIWCNAVRFSSQLGVIPPSPSLKSAYPLAKAQELATAAEKSRQPPQWTFGGRSGLFVPEKHFIGANGEPATLQTTEVHPPVPNEWLEKFGLSIADADVIEQKRHRDRFSTRAECM